MARWPEPVPMDTSRGRTLLSVAIAMPTIATATVIGRFVARRRTRQYLGLDDWVIIAALIALYAQMTLIILSERYGGVGHHASTLTMDNFVAYYKMITAVQFTFGTSLGLAKVSLCLLLIRIFASKNFRIAAYLVLAYNILWILMLISFGVGLCFPIAYNWNKSIPGKCVGNLNAAYVAVAATDILGDVMIMILPMPWVWKLKATKATKFALTFVFALGFVDIVAAILRIIYILQIKFTNDSDFTWDSYGTFMWSIVEPSLGVIVANLGLLRPLFLSCFHGMKTSIGTYGPGSRRLGGSTLKSDAYHNLSASDYPLNTMGGETTKAESTNDSEYQSGNKTIATANESSLPNHDLGKLELGQIRIENEISVLSEPAKVEDLTERHPHAF